MKCSKCGRSCYGTGSSWFKLVKEDIGPTVINGFNQGSNPYFLLCPWCFKDTLGGVKPYVTKMVKETKKISPLPITTYVEQQPLHIDMSSGKLWYEDGKGKKYPIDTIAYPGYEDEIKSIGVNKQQIINIAADA